MTHFLRQPTSGVMLMKGFVLCRIIHGLINALNALRSSPSLPHSSVIHHSANPRLLLLMMVISKVTNMKKIVNLLFCWVRRPRPVRPHNSMWVVSSVAMFAYVFFQMFLLPFWLRSSCSIRLMATRTCQKCPTKYHDGEDAPLRANELR